MNKTILLGRITKDVDLKQTTSGVNVCAFTIAVNRRFAKEGQQTADFINCVAWRNTAEFIAKYFGKGKMIGIVGSLQTGKYEKDGQTHYTTDVLVEEAHFAGGKNESAENNEALPMDDFADFPSMGCDSDNDDLPF